MTRPTDPGEVTRPAAAQQTRRPDPRGQEAASPWNDGGEADGAAALALDDEHDAGLLRLIGAVATALVVLAAAGSLLA